MLTHIFADKIMEIKVNQLQYESGLNKQFENVHELFLQEEAVHIIFHEKQTGGDLMTLGKHLGIEKPEVFVTEVQLKKDLDRKGNTIGAMPLHSDYTIEKNRNTHRKIMLFSAEFDGYKPNRPVYIYVVKNKHIADYMECVLPELLQECLERALPMTTHVDGERITISKPILEQSNNSYISNFDMTSYLSSHKHVKLSSIHINLIHRFYEVARKFTQKVELDYNGKSVLIIDNRFTLHGRNSLDVEVSGIYHIGSLYSHSTRVVY